MELVNDLEVYDTGEGFHVLQTSGELTVALVVVTEVARAPRSSDQSVMCGLAMALFGMR